MNPPVEIQTNTPDQQSNSSIKRANKLLLAPFVLILVAVVVGVLILIIQKRATNTKQLPLTETTKNIDLPSRNIVAYTRCYGGERQPKYCNLYASSLKEPKEELIYTFDFPDIEQTDYEIDEEVYKLYGITDEEKKIIEESLAK